VLVSGFLPSYIVDPVRQLEIVLGEATLGMCGENQGHLVPTDIDIWMVIHELGFMPDLIHEVQGRDKVSQLVRRRNRLVSAIGTAPVRKSRQPLGHLGICQQWAHSLSQGATGATVKS
jgi:hypothetical protein